MLDIREEKTFKVYKKGGVVSLVLRTSFPRLLGDGEGAERFNGLYQRLESECIASAAELAERMSVEGRGGVYLSLCVRYRAEEIKNATKINRIYELKRGREILLTKSVFDVFTNEFCFVKKYKNVKKQRNIPSRNAENITFKAKKEIKTAMKGR